MTGDVPPDRPRRRGRGAQIPTNLRPLLLLEEMARIGIPATPTELNERLGLPKATVHRLCETLEAEGFLMRDLDGRRYTPGRRLRDLAAGTLSSLRVRTARLAILGALARAIGETCNIAIPARDAMVYLDRVETEWPLRIQLPVGTRVPFYCTASGKMYLSSLSRAHRERYLHNAVLERRTPRTIVDPRALAEELARTRRRGYAVDDEEFMEGMVAVAVPIADARGRLFATLSFHAPVQRMSLAKALEHLPRLRRAAAQLTELTIAGG